MMYTFKRVPEETCGDLVLICSTALARLCLAAEVLQRNYLGIDLNAEYCERARQRLGEPLPDAEAIFAEVRVKQARTSLVFE